MSQREESFAFAKKSIRYIYKIYPMCNIQIQKIIMIVIVKTMIVLPFTSKFILGFLFPQNYKGKKLLEKETI